MQYTFYTRPSLHKLFSFGQPPCCFPFTCTYIRATSSGYRLDDSSANCFPCRILAFFTGTSAARPAHSSQHTAQPLHYVTYMYSIYITAQHTGPDQTSSQTPAPAQRTITASHTTRHQATARHSTQLIHAGPDHVHITFTFTFTVLARYVTDNIYE